MDVAEVRAVMMTPVNGEPHTAREGTIGIGRVVQQDSATSLRPGEQRVFGIKDQRRMFDEFVPRIRQPNPGVKRFGDGLAEKSVPLVDFANRGNHIVSGCFFDQMAHRA